jgi:hypothetical protein
MRFTVHRLIKKSIVRANTIGAVITERDILTPLPLFVQTMLRLGIRQLLL